MDSKDSRGLICEKQKDLPFITVMGNSTFGSNNLDKVRDPKLYNKNKKIDTLESFHDTIYDKDMEQTKALYVCMRRYQN